jgi:hypothetical protein
LLTIPAQWQQRVGDIFRQVAGLGETSLVKYLQRTEDTLAPPPAWSDLLNLGLLRVMVRRVGTEVTRIAVGRALRQAADAWPEGFHEGAELAAAGAPFPPEWCKMIRRPQAVFLFAAALVDHLGRLLGTEESAPFRTALAPLLVGREDMHSL